MSIVQISWVLILAILSVAIVTIPFMSPVMLAFRIAIWSHDLLLQHCFSVLTQLLSFF